MPSMMEMLTFAFATMAAGAQFSGADHHPPAVGWVQPAAGGGQKKHKKHKKGNKVHHVAPLSSTGTSVSGPAGASVASSSSTVPNQQDKSPTISKPKKGWKSLKNDAMVEDRVRWIGKCTDNLEACEKKEKILEEEIARNRAKKAKFQAFISKATGEIEEIHAAPGKDLGLGGGNTHTPGIGTIGPREDRPDRRPQDIPGMFRRKSNSLMDGSDALPPGCVPNESL